MSKKYITVYCGSSKGNDIQYSDAAQELAIEMFKADFHLVYGAGNVGLMGVIADKMLDIGGEVIGVIPDHLVQAEVAHDKLTECIVTEDMHTRKAKMADLADAFIAMPGGFGTLEEIVEVMTWAQLGLHKKAIAFYNTNGYYDALLKFIKHMVEEGFLKQEQVDLLIVDDNPNSLIVKIQNFESTYIPKWLQ